MHIPSAAEPILSPSWQVVASARNCPAITAVPTDPSQRSAAEAAYMASLPPCPRDDPVDGIYLAAHPSDLDRSVDGRVFQPACRYADPIAYGTPAEEIQRHFKSRSILFTGDSHVRLAFYKLTEGALTLVCCAQRPGYRGLWTPKLSDPNKHVPSRNDTIGPLKLDWLWNPSLQGKDMWTCEFIAKYDSAWACPWQR